MMVITIVSSVVIILFGTPLFWQAKQQWEQAQEQYLIYVAYTRAMKKLTIDTGSGHIDIYHDESLDDFEEEDCEI